MNPITTPPIDSERLAAKLQRADNLTDPDFFEAIRSERRIPEALWFLQSLRSVECFALEMIEKFPHAFGRAFLHDDNATPALEQYEEVWRLLPNRVKQRFIPENLWLNESDSFNEHYPGHYPNPKCVSEKKLFSERLLKIDLKQLRDVFLDNAKEKLAARLRSFCDPEKDWGGASPWWCPDLLAVLFEAMESHASTIELQLAKTKLVTTLFEKLDFAWSARKFIKIDGDSRTGKTEAIRAWAQMYPGRARLVNTPPGISMRDLFAAIAEALGISFTPATPIFTIKEKVQFVIKYAKIFLIFDEAHWLLPPASSSVSTPARLDWLRSQVMDRRLPCAFVATPQAFNHAVEKFKSRTQYNFDQLFGRVALNVSLPNELDKDDLLEVVKIHAREDIPPEFHREIVRAVLFTESYLQVIEDVCDRARHIAHLNEHEPITWSDIETALVEVIPEYTPSRRSAPALEIPAREISMQV